jgi:Secretion system C-terminal sorting domain
MLRKNLFIILLALGSPQLYAQISNGSYAQNFTLTDLHGGTHDLYSILATGKTVFVDVSATWCPACQDFASYGIMDSLYAQHGPSGSAGVDVATSNDVMVLFVDNESTCLIEGGCGSPMDFASNTLFPICNAPTDQMDSFFAHYQPSFYPTIFMICPNRLVYAYYPMDDFNYYYPKAQAGCPTYGPSSGIDAYALQISNDSFYYCTPHAVFQFQNYSVTDHITNATIKVFSNTTLLDTFSWTGDLAPYAVASVNVMPFADTSFSHYHYEVDAPGDTDPANNRGPDMSTKIFCNANAYSLPYMEDFDGPHTRFTPVYDPFGQYFTILNLQNLVDYDSIPVIGTNGEQTKAVWIDYSSIYHNNHSGTSAAYQDAIIGNYNTMGYTNVYLYFNVAYANSVNDSTDIDALSMLISTDCGDSWTTVWSSTPSFAHAPTDSALFTPVQPSDWKTFMVNISSYADSDMLLKMRATYNTNEYIPGNGWVDNILVTPTMSVGVCNVNATTDVISVYPNPASTSANLLINSATGEQADISLINMLGQTVQHSSAALLPGSNTTPVDLSGLPAGIYSLCIRKGGLTTTLQLCVTP